MWLSIMVGILLIAAFAFLAAAERETRMYHGATRVDVQSGEKDGKSWSFSIWHLPNHPEFSYLVSSMIEGEIEDTHFQTYADAVDYVRVERDSLSIQDWWG